MNEEKKYLKPELEVIEFQNDIVTISDAGDDNGDYNNGAFTPWVQE